MTHLTFDVQMGASVQALRDTVFVVVDLETSGSSCEHDAITEIGAVKVRGGEVLGELATLVGPKRSMPPRIVELTGAAAAVTRSMCAAMA
jgi:DNA polymerase III subunit epsilon